MRVFARDAVLARSKYWYHMKRQHKVRKVQGEIIQTSEVSYCDETGLILACLRFSRRSPVQSRTSESYLDMRRAQTLWTCTRSTEMSPSPEPSPRCTWNWPADTVPELKPSKSSEPQFWKTVKWREHRPNNSRTRISSSHNFILSNVHQTMALSHSTRPSDPPWSEHQSHVSTQRSEVSLIERIVWQLRIASTSRLTHFICCAAQLRLQSIPKSVSLLPIWVLYYILSFFANGLIQNTPSLTKLLKPKLWSIKFKSNNDRLHWSPEINCFVWATRHKQVYLRSREASQNWKDKISKVAREGTDLEGYSLLQIIKSDRQRKLVRRAEVQRILGKKRANWRA